MSPLQHRLVQLVGLASISAMSALSSPAKAESSSNSGFDCYICVPAIITCTTDLDWQCEWACGAPAYQCSNFGCQPNETQVLCDF